MTKGKNNTNGVIMHHPQLTKVLASAKQPQSSTKS